MCNSHCSIRYKKKRQQACGLHQITVLGTVHKGASHKKPLSCTDSLCVVMEVSTASHDRDTACRQLVLEPPGISSKKRRNLFFPSVLQSSTFTTGRCLWSNAL